MFNPLESKDFLRLLDEIRSFSEFYSQMSNEELIYLAVTRFYSSLFGDRRF